MPLRNDRGMAMIGFLVGGVVLAVITFSVVQFAFLFAGQGAVETAAHFAARKFALIARTDLQKAKTSALAEASSICRNRPGGGWESTPFTKLDFSRNGESGSPAGASSGDAYRVRLTHGVELVVPWLNRILFDVAPVPKTRVGNKYYLLLSATRWVTVE